MRRTTSERGQAAVAVVGLSALLVLVAVAAGVFLRVSLARQRTAGAADGAALAAAVVLRDRAPDLLSRSEPGTHRRLPPLLTRGGLDALARAAASQAARAGGAELRSFSTSDGARGVPSYASVEVRSPAPSLPGWVGARRLELVRVRRARAGVDVRIGSFDARRFRPVDLSGLAGVTAVLAAASAQLGWPYLWGGESRAEGGFDCSGLVDYALAAAGFPVGRPTAAGLQQLTRPIAIASALPGDLVFVGNPAHHVGIVARPGVAIEAPHRGSVVHYEALADGGWTSAGRLAVLAAAAPPGDTVPGWVPERFRGALLAASGDENLPAAFLAAQLEAESGFDPSAVSNAGALGLAQFLPATWAGSWNPWRAASPLEPGAAIRAQARYMRGLVDQSEGDLARALAAYHDGWAGSSSTPWPPVTRAYVSAILTRFGGSQSLAPERGLDDMTADRPAGAAVRLVSPDTGTPKG